MLSLKKEKIDSQVRLINNIIRSKPGSHCFFLGAGCSISSGIPLVSQIIEILKKLIFVQYQAAINPLIRGQKETLSAFLNRLDSYIFKYNTEFKDFVSSIENEFLKNLNNNDKNLKKYFGGNPRYELTGYLIKSRFQDSLYGMWFGKYSESPRLRQELIEEIIKDIEPNGAYIFLAHLIKMGHIRDIFTTNFDDLLNDSMLQYFNDKPRVFAHNEIAQYIRFNNNRPNIIKLHGDFLFENIKNINEETELLDNNMKKKFSEALRERHIVFLGYNGADQSIMKIISKVRKEQLFTIYWCGLNEHNLHWRVIKLLNESENAYFIKIRNFDDFIFELFFYPRKAVEINLVQQAKLKEEKMKKYLNSFYKKRFKRSHKICPEEFAAVHELDEWKDIIQKIKQNSASTEEVIKYYKVLYEFNPTIPWIINNYGVILLKSNNHSEALDVIKKGTLQYPKFSMLWYNLGIIYHDTDFLEEAKDAFNKVIKLNPQHATAFNNLAATYNKLREYENDLNNINKAFDIKPCSKFLVLKGIVLKNMNKLTDAIKCYDQAMSYEEYLAEVFLNKANALRLLKDYKDAEKYCFNALEIDSNHEYVYVTLAQIYAETGKVEKFYVYLLEALKRNYPIWRHLDDRAFRIHRNDSEFKRLLEEYCPINM
jgi:tetratricopeptide (TPR) repeat protein